MASKLRNYQTLATGLTQQDTAFRDALEELSGQPVEFYNYRISAYNRLNHALVNSDIDLKHPVQVVGLLDYDDKKMTMSVGGEETEYNLDQIDPRYLATINQINPNKKSRQILITDIAADMLDDMTPEVKKEDKPEVEPHSLSSSREILQRSFANEMVFQAELQAYIEDNNLDSVLSKNADRLSHLVDCKSFEASFNDGLKDLDEKVEEISRNDGQQGVAL